MPRTARTATPVTVSPRRVPPSATWVSPGVRWRTNHRLTELSCRASLPLSGCVISPTRPSPGPRPGLRAWGRAARRRVLPSERPVGGEKRHDEDMGPDCSPLTSTHPPISKGHHKGFTENRTGDTHETTSPVAADCNEHDRDPQRQPVGAGDDGRPPQPLTPTPPTGASADASPADASYGRGARRATGVRLGTGPPDARSRLEGTAPRRERRRTGVRSSRVPPHLLIGATGPVATPIGSATAGSDGQELRGLHSPQAPAERVRARARGFPDRDGAGDDQGHDHDEFDGPDGSRATTRTQ